jgi:transcriptional activator of cad operon
MDRPTAVPLLIGEWRVDPATGQISRGEESVRVEARTLRLLLCLAQRSGEVVSIDDLLNEAWSGVVVTQDSVYQAVASLRRILGDDPKRPTYIATVPRLGYRMVASVGVWTDATTSRIATPTSMPLGDLTADDEAGIQAQLTSSRQLAQGDTRPRSSQLKRGPLLAIVGALCCALAATLLLRNQTPAATRSPAAPPKSVAVLPFLDLTTQAMDEEYFADGMTEELIDKLSKVPGLRVPSPTAVFFFKDKHLKVADIAKSLGVAYVLDGSIRKSDDTLRIAARLTRADDSYVIWSETYDRPSTNKLQIQDEIASQVAKVLETSLVK